MNNPTGLIGGYGFANEFDVGSKPHNAYIRQVVDFGLIGGAAFFLYLYGAILKLWTSAMRDPEKRECSMALYALAGILIACSGNDYIEMRIFWTVAGAAIAASGLQWDVQRRPRVDSGSAARRLWFARP